SGTRKPASLGLSRPAEPACLAARLARAACRAGWRSRATRWQSASVYTGMVAGGATGFAGPGWAVAAGGAARERSRPNATGAAQAKRVRRRDGMADPLTRIANPLRVDQNQRGQAPRNLG